MTKDELEEFLRARGVTQPGRPTTPEEARRPGIRCAKCDGMDVPKHWITCPKREHLS